MYEEIAWRRNEKKKIKTPDLQAINESNKDVTLYNRLGICSADSEG